MTKSQLYTMIQEILDRHPDDVKAGLKEVEQSGFTIIDCCLYGEDADATIVHDRTGIMVSVSLGR